MSGVDGFSLEYLDGLIFFDDYFAYESIEYNYSDVIHIEHEATTTKNTVNSIPTGTTYDNHLVIDFIDKKSISIRPNESFLGIKKKQKFEAVTKAAMILQQLTFEYRLKLYELDIDRKNFVSWGVFQISTNGDVFKDYEFILNLYTKNVTKYPDFFTFFIKNNENVFEKIDISRDRDCFLYFMKNHLGLGWKDYSVREKSQSREVQFYDAILNLGAKLCKIDGRVSPEEIKVFKKYFGIDEKSYPNSGKIFSEAVESSKSYMSVAKNIFEQFDGDKEPLEYIVIGLLRIAMADGVLSDSEKNFIYKTAKEFKLSKPQIDRLFFIHAGRKNKDENTDAKSAQSKHYEVLGLKGTENKEQIKKAYKDMVRRHHPDLLMSKGVPLSQIKDAEEMLKMINISYKWIIENK